MASYKPIIFTAFVIIFFVVLYKVSHSPANDADKYFSQYFAKVTTVKVLPGDQYESNYTVIHTHYNSGFSIIGYKALSGKIFVFNFLDSISNKYFALRIFDKDDQYTHPIRQTLVNTEVFVYVNSDDLNNPAYGSKENPVPAFSFKGIKEPINVGENTTASGTTYDSIEPTLEDYKHNVMQYLTYTMTKDEFNKRFEGAK